MKNSIMKKLSLLLTGILLLSLLACAGSAHGEYWPTKAWQVSSPEKQEMDPDALKAIDAYVAESLPDTSSVLVVRNGFIVFERYYEGDRETKRPVHSITKSLVSALIGILVGKGTIANVDDPIAGLLPDAIRGGMNEATRKITVRHLLTQTSGFPGDSGLGSVDPRALRSLLSVPPATGPGEAFAYNEANANLLSVIITQASEAKASSFAERFLLGPMGIRNARWSDGVEYTEGAGGLTLTTREMAKLGLLYLRQGRWEKKQLVPEEWIARSTMAQLEVKGFTLGGSTLGYGYLWWTANLAGNAMAFAMGIGGQYICVIPHLGLVVVLTGTDSKVQDRLPIVRDFVMPAATQ
jgi:CubicO group peptidase (beta-lactamase class C family)